VAWRFSDGRRHTDTVRRAAFSPDGKRVVTASSDNTARLWDADRRRVLASLADGGGLAVGFRLSALTSAASAAAPRSTSVNAVGRPSAYSSFQVTTDSRCP
jgi:WD40 repeat protein